MSEPFENRVTCCISDSFIYSICIKCRGAQKRLRAGSEAAAQDPEELPVQLGARSGPWNCATLLGLGDPTPGLHCARLHLQLLMKDSSVQLVAVKRAFVIVLRRHFMGAAG